MNNINSSSLEALHHLPQKDPVFFSKWKKEICVLVIIAALGCLLSGICGQIGAINTLNQAAVIALVATGVVLLIVSITTLCYITCKNHKAYHKKAPKAQINNVKSAIADEVRKDNKTDATLHAKNISAQPKASQKELNDKEIIQNLQNQGYSRPIEEGADGRCLFWSILPQITDADIKKGASSRYAKYFANWETLPTNNWGDDKLDRLRQMALAEEEDFINSIPVETQAAAFSSDQKDRIFELYKDMVQELENLSPSGVRERLENLIAENPDPKVVLSKQFLYCKTHFVTYKTRTQKKTNWAGTSELIALGKIFERQVMAFGKDIYAANLDENGNVLPYYSSIAKTNPLRTPIVVFQCNGGGHYRRLIFPNNP